MDDQFGGRTDDDLFSDDFEPAPSAQSAPPPAANAPVDAPVAASKPAAKAPAPKQAPKAKPEQAAKPAPPHQPHKSMATSRHARPAQTTRPPKQTPAPSDTPVAAASSPAPAPASVKHADPPVETTSSSTDSPQPEVLAKPPPTGPAKELAAPNAPPAAKAGGSARLGSGANPRTKLTDTELAAKMEKMRILAAEKTRKFEEEKRDESEHAAAYARGMEEARKRRVADEEKRRRGDEERRRLEEERAKNRERKLRALGMQEGGWDEGKQAALEEEDRRGFRGAHGGVRGARSSGLASSRYADEGHHEDYDRGGRGRGRGRGGRGRGRGGFDGSDRPAPAPSKQAVPKVDDFPALPVAKPPKVDTVLPPLTSADLPMSPPVGKWDEEVEAEETKNAKE